MTDIMIVVACAECGVAWPLGTDDPLCVEPRHVHQRHEVHRHRNRVVLPDGTKVVAASLVGTEPYEREVVPDFGLYFDPRWQPPWPYAVVDWPDFGVPGDLMHFRSALQDVLARSRDDQRVEIGCLGGHGRTGTALACLAVLTGHNATEAVAWVRSNYCPEAVETDEQHSFVSSFTP